MNRGPLDDNDFWKGWKEALDALETRLGILRVECTSRSTTIDFFLDLKNEIRELRAPTVDDLTKNA